MHYAKLKLHFRQVLRFLLIFCSFRWLQSSPFCVPLVSFTLLFDREIIDPFTSMSCTRNEIKRVKSLYTTTLNAA